MQLGERRGTCGSFPMSLNCKPLSGCIFSLGALSKKGQTETQVCPGSMGFLGSPPFLPSSSPEAYTGFEALNGGHIPNP